MRKRSGGLGLIIGIIVVLIMAAVLVGVWSAINQFGWPNNGEALESVQRTNEELSTQVSQLLNPTPTLLPDPVTIIHDVRALARLETIQYSVEKVITAETNQDKFGFLFGDRLLLVAHGEVIAGVDLGKLQPGDLRVEGGVLYVRMPVAEVSVATLDNNKSYVYDRDTSLLARGTKDLETTARQAAETEILEAALEDGILHTAQVNAEAFLEPLFHELGFEEVVFELAGTPASTPIPAP